MHAKPSRLLTKIAPVPCRSYVSRRPTPRTASKPDTRRSRHDDFGTFHDVVATIPGVRFDTELPRLSTQVVVVAGSIVHVNVVVISIPQVELAVGAFVGVRLERSCK